MTLFPHQRQDGEAINVANKIADEILRIDGLGVVEIGDGDTSFIANRIKVVVKADNVLHQHPVWQWYRVAGRNLTNRYEGKVWEGIARPSLGCADCAWIAISTP